jgi:outer membrane protein insertion porin family
VRAFDPFTVKDIRVEGVQRTEAGTIFSYLPIKVGERVDDEKVAQAVKALYATGFFRDVRIEAQGDVLLVTVQERPTISSLTFVGNKVRHRDRQEDVEGRRDCRSAHLRPVGAQRAEQG